MEQSQWHPIGAAAKLLGVSTQAIRARMKRGTIESRKNNRGKLTVLVTGADINNAPDALPNETPTLATAMVTSTIAKSVPADDSAMVHELRRQVDKMQTMMTDLQSRHDAEIARRLAERDTLHSDALGRLQTQASLERALWIERIDSAEMRAERVEEKLDMVLDELLAERRSWLSRWFGSSKQSTLRNR